MLLHIFYHDKSNPFVSLGDLAPADCFKLYRRKAAEYARIKDAEPPPLFCGDPARPAGTLEENANIAFFFTIKPTAGGPPIRVHIYNSGPRWCVCCAGYPISLYYTSPGRAFAALKRRAGGDPA